MSAFVLVHGAWGGAWIWRRVLGPLRAAGHEVHAVTLTGNGERARLAGVAVARAGLTSPGLQANGRRRSSDALQVLASSPSRKPQRSSHHLHLATA